MKPAERKSKAPWLREDVPESRYDTFRRVMLGDK
jgi:hypothetical protein